MLLLLEGKPVYHSQPLQRFNSPLWETTPLPFPRQCFYDLCSLEQFLGVQGENWSFQRRALDWLNCSALAYSRVAYGSK